MRHNLKKPDNGRAADNYAYNAGFRFDGFIYNQSGESDAGKVRMGGGTGETNGCGWIAAYNLLYYLGHKADVPRMINEFETGGGTLPRLGCAVSPLAVADCLAKRGLKASLKWLPGAADPRVRNAKAAVLIFLNGYRPLNAHYVFAHFSSGAYHLYNPGVNCLGVLDTGSIDGWLKQRKYFLFGVITL